MYMDFNNVVEFVAKTCYSETCKWLSYFLRGFVNWLLRTSIQTPPRWHNNKSEIKNK